MSSNQNDSPVWKEWTEKSVSWVKKYLPWTLLLGVWRYFKRKLWYADRKVEEAELEVKHYEAKEEIHENNASLSDRELVNDMLSEGAEYQGHSANSKAKPGSDGES